MSGPGRLARVVAAVTLGAAAYAAVPAAPAAAAACPTADGVTVVVDFHELGGGAQSVCVPDGGGDRASSLFPAAGFGLSYVQRQPGFVCRVAGKPADDPCVNTPPADAYWGLYWSDGKSGSWTYSTAGVGALSVPEGGYVALSWQGSDSRANPGVAPTPRPAAPTSSTPTPAPSSAQPTKAPSAPSTASSSTAPAASATPTASTGPSEATGTKRKKPRGGEEATLSATRSPSASASPSTTDEDVAPASADATDAGDGGLPAWVAPLLVVGLFGAAGGVALARRRRGGAA